MDEEILKCHTCHETLSEEKYYCFPSVEQTGNVWCEKCWEDLQKYLKQKWKENKLPELQENAKVLLEDCDKNKCKFMNLIKQTKRYITSLTKIATIKDIKDIKKFEEQISLTDYSKKEEVENETTN